MTRGRRFFVVIILIFASIGFSGCRVIVDSYPLTPNPVLLTIPRRDLVYQTSFPDFAYVEDTRTNTVGFVNIDGTKKIVLPVQEDKTYLHSPRVDPLNGMFFYLKGKPNSDFNGWLVAYQDGVIQQCSAFLTLRPSRVGVGLKYVGVYYWRKDGGIVLMDFAHQPCKKIELFTPQEMEGLKVQYAVGFHLQEKILLIGEKSYVYDLTTQQMERVPLPPAQVCRVSPRDTFVACLFQKSAYEKVRLRVFRVEGFALWRERDIFPKVVPSFGIGDISWSPSGDAVVYHRCIRPDEKGPYYSCQSQGQQNLGIYVWSLDTDKERLVTPGGIMPYWIDWSGVPSERPTP